MSKHKDAELILRLYEMRREPTMREARNWFLTFNPESVDDIKNVIFSDKGAYYRMVTTYWDMACSFVNHDALDEVMFNDANAEHVMVFAKVAPFVKDLREYFGNPNALKHLEKVVMRKDNAEQMLAVVRERFKGFAARAPAPQQQQS